MLYKHIIKKFSYSTVSTLQSSNKFVFVRECSGMEEVQMIQKGDLSSSRVGHPTQKCCSSSTCRVLHDQNILSSTGRPMYLPVSIVPVEISEIYSNFLYILFCFLIFCLKLMYALNFVLDKYYAYPFHYCLNTCSAGDNYMHDSGYSFSPRPPRAWVQG